MTLWLNEINMIWQIYKSVKDFLSFNCSKVGCDEKDCIKSLEIFLQLNLNLTQFEFDIQKSPLALKKFACENNNT